MDSLFDTEHLYRSYFKLSFPVVLGMVVTLIYNLADTYFIAQTGDTDLIAGVSLCAPVFTLLMAFGNIFGQGGSTLISRLLGQKNMEGCRRISSFCFYIAIATGIVLALLMVLFGSAMLQAMGADAETLSHAYRYYMVLAVCAPVIIVSFIHQNLVRCEGLATESMIGTILGAVINIVLDPILISVFGLGAMGAAVATVIGYLCSVIYFLWLLKKKTHSLSIQISDCHVNKQELRQILGIGLSAALSNLMQSLTIMIMNTFLLPYGNDKIAAMGIVLKINMIAQLMLVGFAFGGAPLFGYLYGAHQSRELKKLIHFCLGFMCSVSLVLTLLIWIFASPLMQVFVQDAALISTGVLMLRWQVVTTVFAGIVLLLTILFQAAGKVIPAFLLSISRQGVIFVAAAIVCVNLFAYQGVLMAQAIADVLSAGLALGLLIVCNPMRMEAAETPLAKLDPKLDSSLNSSVI